MIDATAQEGPKLSFKGERQLRYYWFIALTMMIVAPLAGVYPIFLMKILCFAIFACAFNLLVGFTGLVSFGHAAFFGVSAYVTGWLAVNGFTPEIAIAGGVLTAAAMAFVVAILSIRRQGIYFAMITLALSQLVFFMCLQAPFTGGEDGLQRIPRGNLFGLISLKSDLAMYFFILFAFHYLTSLLHQRRHRPLHILLGICFT